MAKHKDHTHTVIDHHSDGSHTVHRHHRDGSKHSSAHHDLDGVHDALEEHVGTPDSPHEEAAEAGDHGIPAEHATPAGLPVPGMPGGPVGA